MKLKLIIFHFNLFSLVVVEPPTAKSKNSSKTLTAAPSPVSGLIIIFKVVTNRRQGFQPLTGFAKYFSF
jgi:hypothetical protein